MKSWIDNVSSQAVTIHFGALVAKQAAGIRPSPLCIPPPYCPLLHPLPGSHFDVCTHTSCVLSPSSVLSGVSFSPPFHLPSSAMNEMWMKWGLSGGNLTSYMERRSMSVYVCTPVSNAMVLTYKRQWWVWRTHATIWKVPHTCHSLCISTTVCGWLLASQSFLKRIPIRTKIAIVLQSRSPSDIFLCIWFQSIQSNSMIRRTINLFVLACVYRTYSARDEIK